MYTVITINQSINREQIHNSWPTFVKIIITAIKSRERKTMLGKTTGAIQKVDVFPKFGFISRNKKKLKLINFFCKNVFYFYLETKNYIFHEFNNKKRKEEMQKWRAMFVCLLTK